MVKTGHFQPESLAPKTGTYFDAVEHKAFSYIGLILVELYHICKGFTIRYESVINKKGNLLM